MDIILATLNVHKILEFREMLKTFKKFDTFSLHQFSHYIPLAETGKSFKENVTQKAIHAAKALNCLVLADDSGLVVPILNGAPGIYSRRYAGDDATDAENRKKLLEALKERTGLERSAYFECSLALATPEGLKKYVFGRCEGVIAPEEKGRNGFGYDSIFVKHDYDKTFAELDDAVKNRISHRRKAFEKMALVLETL